MFSGQDFLFYQKEYNLNYGWLLFIYLFVCVFIYLFVCFQLLDLFCVQQLSKQMIAEGLLCWTSLTYGSDSVALLEIKVKTRKTSIVTITIRGYVSSNNR